MWQKLVVVVLFALTYAANADEFPAGISKCHFGDEACYIAQGDKLLVTTVNGWPEIGLEQQDPLIIDRIEILGDKQKAANIDLLLTDAKFHNFSRATIKSIKGLTRDTSKPMKISYLSFNPQLTIKSKYKIDGNVLILPIRGEGDLTMVLMNITTRIIVFVRPVQRDGKTYLTIDDVKVQTEIENAHVDLTNLFNGDKALSENVLKVMNENWRVLGQEISPMIDIKIGEKVKDGLEKIMGNIPYDEFFLPDE